MPRLKKAPPIVETPQNMEESEAISLLRGVNAKLEATQQVQSNEQLVRQFNLGLNVQAPAFKASITSMAELCGQWFTVVQGFNQTNFAADLMLVTTELAEACEADRKNAQDDHVPQLEGRTAELADALVRILHMAHKYQLPLADAFVAKMAFNLTRPVKHGKAY